MSDAFNFINDIFKRLSYNDDVPAIVVKNSKDVKIIGNQINPVYQIYNDTSVNNTVIDLPPIKGLEYENSTVNNALERAERNNDYLERFIFYCNQQKIIPNIRCYAFFSHLSSIRDRNDMNEYNQLILSERELFYQMLKLDFNVRLIISLDIPTILAKWYDDISSAINRITDLISNVDDVCENNNIIVVIDENNSLDGQFILHNSLFIHALSADRKEKYNITQYETDPAVINNAILNFDRRFNYLVVANQQAKKLMQTSSMSTFIKHTLDARFEEWNRKLEKSKK